MPEEFTLRETFDDSAAVDGNKGVSPTLLVESMDALREQLLSGSGLSFNQDGDVADLRGFTRALQHGHHVGAARRNTQSCKGLSKLVV